MGETAKESARAAKRINRDSPQAANRRINRKTEGVQVAILDAAAEVFARKGYHLTKLSDISDQIGLHVTALRYHFPTKEVIAAEIVNRVARTNLERIEAVLREFPAGSSVRDRVAAAIRTYMHVAASNRIYIAAHGNILNQLPEDMRQLNYGYLRDFLGIWRGLIGEAKENGELSAGLNPSIATQVILGSVIWSKEWYRPELGTPDVIADEITRALFGGVLVGGVLAGRQS